MERIDIASSMMFYVFERSLAHSMHDARRGNAKEHGMGFDPRTDPTPNCTSDMTTVVVPYFSSAYATRGPRLCKCSYHPNTLLRT